MKVVVFGASGMLGSMITDYLSRRGEFKVRGLVRTPGDAERLGAIYPNVEFDRFAFDRSGNLTETLDSAKWIINAVGITKPRIRDDNPAEIERAIAINALFPHDLALAAQNTGAKVIQIATDCVYSGLRGGYVEADAHDALDVYGKTKSLGETWIPSVQHLRCSIIGPEPKEFKFLIEWFRRQPRNAQVNGFTNHRWNGVTTLQFAKLCAAIMSGEIPLGHLQHVVPKGSLTKADMLRVFADAYGRTDVAIREIEAATVIDRTLRTANADLNLTLWKAAGYSDPPTVAEMIAELASWDYRAAPVVTSA